jgi:chromate transporter
MTEIVLGFLKIGVTGYGGPALMGLMQAEFQERQQWTSKPRFLEGLALVNILPGATAVQLAIFLGYTRAGWWGGLLAGLSFAVPGFVVLLVLTVGYSVFGANPILRGALYGVGPVVLSVFVAAAFRLGKTAIRSWTHALIAIAAAATLAATPLGAAAVLVLAGTLAVFLFHDKRVGAITLALVVAALAAVPLLIASSPTPTTAEIPTLGRVAKLFAGIGAFTFGGGLSILALMQEHVVHRLHWLTPREFVDGLALGQLTPGPIIMVAAYVGYKTLGLAGALVAATASFLPSFVLMLAVLPVFDRIRNLGWARATMQGIVPAVIGVLAVVLVRMAPHAAPDLPAMVALVVTTAVLLVWRFTPLKGMAGGALFGILRDRVWAR